MNPNYQVICRKLVYDFILKSTRFSIANIKMESFKAFDYEFEIDYCFHVQIKGVTETVSGRPAAQINDLLYHRADEYKRALEEHSRIELNRSETLDELLALVRTEKYGHIDQNYFLHQYERRILYKDSCPSCGGSGALTCNVCRGSGKVPCSICGGRGRIENQRTVYDHYSKTLRVEYYQDYCPTCNASGKKTCSSCGGRGEVTCTNCHGRGSLTDVSVLQSQAVSEYSLVFSRKEVEPYIREAIYKAGVPRLGDCGDIAEIATSIERESKNVRARYSAVLPFAQFKTPLKQNEVKWVLYADPPRIFDSGQILEIFLTDDFEELKKLTPHGNFSTPFIAAKARRALSDFMESEVHQTLLENSRQGMAGNDLREKLNRSLSQTYIDESLKNLESLTSSIVRWSNIGWLVALVLTGYLALALLWAPLYSVAHDASSLGVNAKTARIYYPTIYVQPATQFSYFLVSYGKAIAWTIWELIGIWTGLFFSLGAVLAHYYRVFWFRRVGGNIFAHWVKDRQINTNRFVLFFFLGLALLGASVVLFPYWLNEAGLIFGILPPTGWLQELEDILGFPIF